MIITGNEAILAAFAEKIPPDAPLALPPPVFETMQSEFLEFDTGAKVFKAKFPVLPKYHNPLYYMQGGMIVAAIDNTIGPLSFLVAPPSVTKTLNANYIRPVGPDIPYITVTARVTEQTRRQIFFEAIAYNPAGKILVIVTATQAVIGE